MGREVKGIVHWFGLWGLYDFGYGDAWNFRLISGFWGWRGEMRVEFRDGSVRLREGEMCVAARGGASDGGGGGGGGGFVCGGGGEEYGGCGGGGVYGVSGDIRKIGEGWSGK